MTLKSRLKSQKKKAFTLIELLVVISIIALLLSILMPALTKVKEQAKAIVCASNLKQWNIILSFFTADNEDRFPDADYNDDGTNDGRGQWWFLPLRPYFIDQPDILVCGKAKIKQDTNSSAPWVIDGRYFPQKNDECWGRRIMESTNHPDVGQWVWSSYGPNAWLIDPRYGRWGTTNVLDSSCWGKFASITNPSRVPVYLDSRHVDSWTDDIDTPSNDEIFLDGDGAMQIFAMRRHNKSINAVFGDGSVNRVNITDIWKLKWHKTFDTRNPYADGTLAFPDWMD